MGNWKTMVVVCIQINAIIGFHIADKIKSKINEKDYMEYKRSNPIALNPISILETLTAVGEGTASNWQTSEFQVNGDANNAATLDILEDSHSTLEQNSHSFQETGVISPVIELEETLTVEQTPAATTGEQEDKGSEINVEEESSPLTPVVQSEPIVTQPSSHSKPIKPVSITNSTLSSSPSKPGTGWTQWSPLPEFGWQQSTNGGQLSGGSQQLSMNLQGNFADITSTNNVQTNINTYGSGTSNVQYFGGKPKDPQNQGTPNRFQVQLKNQTIV